ncbi:MAG: hypothetical protein Q8O64_08395 [Sideroxyarcus sp.]|nr:hypothetical protein [Sideroxyarcus sp.]
MSGIVTAVEAHAIAETLKKLHGQFNWTKRDNHVGHLVASARVEDADGAILPSLIVEVEIKAAISFDRCLFLFTLFIQKHGAKLRAYQVEIAPQNKHTHIETGNIIRGAHEHWGDKVIALIGFGCDDYSRGFAHFCQQINLTAIQLELPS